MQLNNMVAAELLEVGDTIESDEDGRVWEITSAQQFTAHDLPDYPDGTLMISLSMRERNRQTAPMRTYTGARWTNIPYAADEQLKLGPTTFKIPA